MTIKEWFKTQFTLDAFKASLPIWKAVFSSGWNWLMFVGLTLACIEGFKHDAYAGCGFLFLSSWLVVHRYIIAFKNMQLKDFMNRGE